MQSRVRLDSREDKAYIDHRSIVLVKNGFLDENNNACDERNTKVTLVVCGTPELVEAMRRINAAGVDCWMCDEYDFIQHFFCSDSLTYLSCHRLVFPLKADTLSARPP